MYDPVWDVAKMTPSDWLTVLFFEFTTELGLNMVEQWYPLVNIQKAIENGPVEIVDLPMKNSDFP